MMKALWLLPCITLVLSAADVSGRWEGSIEVSDTASGAVINTPVQAEFVQKDTQLSGKIGRRGEDDQTEAIRNGRLDGKKISFEVSSLEAASVMKFALTLDGDRLEGEMKGSIDTGSLVGKVHLKRRAGP